MYSFPFKRAMLGFFLTGFFFARAVLYYKNNIFNFNMFYLFRRECDKIM